MDDEYRLVTYYGAEAFKASATAYCDGERGWLVAASTALQWT